MLGDLKGKMEETERSTSRNGELSGIGGRI